MDGVGAAAAFLAATIAAWPDREWFLSGNYPNRWWDPSVLAAPMEVVLGGEVENYKTYIDRNAKHVETNANWLRAGPAGRCRRACVRRRRRYFAGLGGLGRGGPPLIWSRVIGF
jgi:hypothetical protein